jgi:hypothetical protein
MSNRDNEESPLLELEPSLILLEKERVQKCDTSGSDTEDDFEEENVVPLGATIEVEAGAVDDTTSDEDDNLCSSEEESTSDEEEIEHEYGAMVNHILRQQDKISREMRECQLVHFADTVLASALVGATVGTVISCLLMYIYRPDA